MLPIKIDTTAEPSYGHDQAYIDYPTVFPTVTLLLEPIDDTADEFYVGLNGFTKTHVDNCITGLKRDADETITIDLTEDEQREVYAALDEQCRAAWGRGCEDLLAEARAKIPTNEE